MRARIHLAAVAASVLLTTAASSQMPRASFPMQADGADPVTGLAVLRPLAADIAGLRQLDQVVLSDVALPSGESVDLQLQQLDLGKLRLGFHVDGLPAPGLLEGLDLSVWKGTVAGAADSEVIVSFSNSGTSGWIRHGGELVHLMPEPGRNGSWADNHTLMATEESLLELGMSMDAFCGADRIQDLPRLGQQLDGLLPSGGPGGASGGGIQGIGTVECEYYECPIAIETDYQLFQIFNDLGAETAYVTTLLAAVSARYEEQVDTVLTFPYVQFYTTSSDPWSTPDIPGSMIDMLNEFVPAWEGNIPGGAIIGHFLSGASLGGGVAYLGILCDTAQNFSFAVSGSLGGNTPFPITVGPNNWDFMVVAHETGHNFNSPHTHDYSPQIDDCPGGNCITDGTIMSYCHQCPGGLSNITTYFNEPAVTNVMKSHAAACLPFIAPVVPDAPPVLIDPDTPLVVGATVLGTPVGGVDFNYRFDSGSSYTSVPAVDLGGGVWNGTVPGASCGSEPEFFFSMTDASCGAYSSAVATTEIGFETILQTDELEVASGWTAGVAGDDATTGVWERGDPIGTGAQPEDDHTPSGTDCYFTGQGSPGGSLGENDIDGGTTTLLSPVIDLSSGDARMSYWRWYSNDAGSTPNTDTFVVDISNNGGGSWTNVEVVGPAGEGTSGGWVFHEFTVSDFVTPTASMQLRFVASDLGDGSLVEAAIDDLKVSRVECSVWEDLGGGTSGINGVPNLVLTGPLTAGSLLQLDMTNGAPAALSALFIAVTSTPTPFLGGTLHPIPWVDLVFVATDGSGGLSGSATFGGAPPGTELYLQVAVADASVAGFNASLSNGVKGTVP